MARACLLAALVAISLNTAASAATGPTLLSDGQAITPIAAPGASFQPLNPHLAELPDYTVGQAVTSATSPDGNTLLVLTSGFNRVTDAQGKVIPAASTEFVFIFDISAGAPRQLQALPVPNSFAGMAFAPDGTRFYVSGGVDDCVHVFERSGAGWAETGAPIELGHQAGNGLAPDPAVSPRGAAGLAVTPDGKTLLVANFENDSVSLIDLQARSKTAELDLRPGKIDPAKSGVAGGEFPYWIAVKNPRTAYISSERDREIVGLSLGGKPAVAARIPVKGSPNRMVLSRDGRRLYVAADDSDLVLAIDTQTNRVISEIPATAPEGFLPDPRMTGSIPNSLALSPDEKTLYVTDGGTNALAVIALDGKPRVTGLIPTGDFPNAVSVSADGKTLYVINGKGPAGPNPANCVPTSARQPASSGCPTSRPKRSGNQYMLQLTKAGMLTLPVPDAPTLEKLTSQVAANNHFSESVSPEDETTMAALRARIKHVIYIVKENRTYDQILGDLPTGNGDPALAQFPATLTPNQHKLASTFVDVDDFFDAGDVSGNGWIWSTAARTTDYAEKTIPVQYARRGFTYDEEGTNRYVNTGIATLADRREANPMTADAPDILPGAHSVTAPDGPDGDEDGGYLWNAALRSGKSIRNYGFFLDLMRYEDDFKQPDLAKKAEALRIPLLHDPFATKSRVAFPSDKALAPFTDLYFRGFDNNFADLFRYREWAREFDRYAKDGKLPALEFVRFMHDHMGNFATAADGVNTPETQQADNDYAVGLLVEKLAHSRYAKDTLVFVVEDDAQDGPDHVDAHRSIAFIAGPYVKHGVVISTRYSTVNLLRTIEDVLGIAHLSLNDSHARPMADLFDLKQADWSFDAVVPDILRSTQLPLPGLRKAATARPLHDAAYWAEKTRGMDFGIEDKLDTPAFNRILWEGLMPGRPYPQTRSHADLRADRAALLGASAH
jgi:YVTN family beta-propeller protein